MTFTAGFALAVLFLFAPSREGCAAPVTADDYRGMSEEEILKAYDYRLRVRVINNARRIKLNPLEACELRDARGDRIAEIKAGSFIKLETPKEIEREGLYRVYLEDFSIWEKNPARLMALDVRKKLRLNGQVIDITMRIRHFKDFYPFWNKGVGRKLVVAGGFVDEAEAQKLAGRLRAQYPKARVIFDQREQAKRVIRVTLGSGEALGEFDDRVSLVQRSNEARTYFEALQNEKSSWRLHTRTDAMVRGDFEAYTNEWELLRMANVVHVEQYLYGVVPVEIYPTAPPETLKAQAIAARTTALFRVARGQNGDKHFDLARDFTIDMEYGGYPHENPAATAAVDATRGQVMFFTGESGKRYMANAVFCACCGGVTVDSHERWQHEKCSYLIPRFDRRFFAARPPQFNTEAAARKWIDREPVAFCNPDQAGISDNLRKMLDRRYRWETRMSPRKLSQAINKQFNLGAVDNVRVASRGASGRVSALEFTLSDGRKIRTDANDIEKIAALSFARSLFFYIDPPIGGKDGSVFTIRGAGYGHGVGMCQVGAMGMGERGYTAAAILRHYYNDIDFAQLY